MAEKYHIVSFKVKGPAPAQKAAKPKRKRRRRGIPTEVILTSNGD